MSVLISKRLRQLSLVTAGLLLGLSGFVSAQQVPATTVETSPCYVKGFEDRMTCGSIKQPLRPDEQGPDAATIDIHFAIIPAIKPSHSTEAVMAFAGGPGQGAIEFAGGFARSLRYVRETRDILLVDQRGTGRSQRLQCESEEFISPYEFDERQIDTDQLTKDESIRCVDALNTDLSAFSTVNAASDFEAVRQALGYQGLHLYGVSYGSRIAQEFTRQYPGSVLTSTLDGVVPMQQSLANIGIAIDDAMQAVFADCRADTGCNQVHSNLEEKLKTVITRLRNNPATIQIRHPKSHKMINFVVTPDKFLGSLRLALYSHVTRALIPLVITQGMDNDYSTLTGLMSDSDMLNSLAMGMHNVIVCGEDWPILDKQTRADLQGSFFAEEMVKAFDLICPIWDVTPVTQSFYQPLSNDIPTLLLSGGLDPATPPSWAELAMVNMTNARHLIAPSATHNVIAQSCANKLVRQFVDEASAENIDAECMEKDTRKRFFMNVNGVVAPQTATEQEG